MNEITELYFKSAQELGLDPVPEPIFYGFKVIIKGVPYYFRHGQTPLNNSVGVEISINKYVSNLLFAQAGIPTTKATVITRDSFLKDKRLDNFDLRFPVVAKPCFNSSCGRSVNCNIKNKGLLIQYLAKKLRRYQSMSVEEFKPNLRSYRVLVVKDKVVGLAERIAAQVEGDGRHTLAQLIEKVNSEREQIDEYVPFLPIEINEETNTILEEKGITLDYIPWPHEIVPLRYVCNTSRGGTCESLPVSLIHPENAKIAVKAVKALNLQVAGLDFLCEDIEKPITQTQGYVLEANADPDISLHENAQKGPRVQVTKEIMKAFMDEYPTSRLKIFLLKPLVLFGFMLSIVVAYLIFFLMYV